MRKHVGERVLSLYLDGKVDAARKAMIEDHLASCPICGKSLSLLKGSIGLLKGLSEIKESEHFDFEYNRRLQMELAGRAESRPLTKRIGGAFERAFDVFARPVPVLVKAVSVITVIAVFMGTIVWDQMGVVPAIASVEGEARVYDAAADSWAPARAGMRLKDGDKVFVGQGSVNIRSDRYEIMIKEQTRVTARGLERAFAGNDDISYGIDRGRMLIAARKGFGSANLKIDSPAAVVSAGNTGFMVAVAPEESDKTWVGVLDGRVEVRSKALSGDAVSSRVYVEAGKATEVAHGQAPRIPRYQRQEEWEQMREIYTIGDQPTVILLVSMTPRRVYDLLEPAGVYLSDKKTRAMPRKAREITKKINAAIAEGDKEKHLDAIRDLERLVKRYPDRRYDLQFRFFIAAYYCYVDEYAKAIRDFDRIIEDYPGSRLLSLATCAKGVIYEKWIGDPVEAAGAYKEVLNLYPDSLEAETASRGLQRLSDNPNI